MGNWQTVSANAFCVSVRDGTHDSPKPAHRGKKLITSRHIIGDRIDLENAYLISDNDFESINRRSKVDQWDVLITMIGTVGEPCLVRSTPNFAIKNIGLFKSKGELEGRWLYYYLRTPQAQQLIRERSAGTTQAYISLGALRNLPIPVIDDRDEMHAITSILGALDNKIDLNRRMNETLGATAQVIFNDWFINFGPTRAKMEGRASYLAPEVWALFPARLDDEGKPEGWSICTVADIGKVICGKTPPTKVTQYYGDAVPFIGIPDMHGKIFALTTARRLSAAGAAYQATKTIPAGSICVSCIATPGLVVITTRPSQTNQQINSVVPKNADQLYFWYWILKGLGDDIRQGGSGGSVLSNLSTGRFSSLNTLFASEEIRIHFHKLIAPLFDHISSNERESITLAATRDLLLPKLMSGEVRVKEVAEIARAAA